MKRNVYLISSVLLALLCVWSCTDDDSLDSSALLQMYGRQYKVETGVIWKNNPKEIFSTIPYIYKDTYVNAAGETVTDDVVGFAVGEGKLEVGNFMLSLYESGFVFNESLKAAKGRGACICLHLSSSDPENLVPGKYVFGNKQKENTFVGYCSSDYATENLSSDASLAEIIEGEVTLERAGEVYSVEFQGKTSFGGGLTAKYSGKLEECQVPLLASSSVENLHLSGLMDSVTVTTIIFGDRAEEKTLDVNNGTAFLSSSKGVCQTAKGPKESVDIALVWDDEKETFYFESPIRMRSMLGHSDAFKFPCHTIYMRAPDSFTDADYDKLEETGLVFDIHDEKVEFTTSSFEPGFVLFQAGNGIKGVLRVKGYIPMGKKLESVIPGVWEVETVINPALKIDMKCPANFVNPRIR